MPSDKKDTPKKQDRPSVYYDSPARERFFDILDWLRALPGRLKDGAGAVWVWVVAHTSVLLVSIGRTLQSWKAQLSWRKERRERAREAYNNLVRVTGSYDDGQKTATEENNPVRTEEQKARTKAKQSVAETAREAADKAPTGSMSPREAMQRLEEEPMLDSVMLQAVADPFAMADTSDQKPNARKTQKRAMQSINDPTSNIKATDSISVGKADQADPGIEHVTDEVVPPPYRSEIKKTDLTVRGTWEQNPNAIETVQEASRFPIVDRQITKTIEHLSSSGAKIVGPPEQAEVIRKWFEVDLEYSTGYKKGLNRYIEDISEQMLRYGSAAVFKQRTRSDLMEPYEDPLTGANRAPVHGYGIADMSTIEAFIDKKGRPRKWRQVTPLWSGSAGAKEYRDRDVFVARLPIRNSAMYFWTPSLVMPVLYAVEVLKDLHDTIDSHTQNIVDIPSYAQVGDNNYIDGKVTPSMLQKVARSIQTTARGMMLIMPWYVNLEKHESDEYTEELTNTANFWEKIVRRGVGGNQFDDGDGGTSNRRTADVLQEKDMLLPQAMVPEIQRSFRWLFVDKLLENGFTLDEIASHDDMVGVVFEDIDLSKQMAREGHIVFKFQNDGMTHGEYRKALGFDVDPEREDMYYSEIQKEVQKEVDSAKAEAQSRARPNGEPKPKRKNDNYPHDMEGAHGDPIV